MPKSNSESRPNLSIEDIKSACARLIAGDVQGTAYLVSPDLLITCEHVVRSAGLGATVQASFYQSNTPLPCAVEEWNAQEDWAALRLAVPVRDRLPLRCAMAAIPDMHWSAFGFPVSASKNGILLSGKVRDPNAIDHKGSAVQLYCEEAAAAKGAFLQGGSGSPVVSQGQVIGHMRNILPDETGRSEMGIVFACPSSAFASTLPPQESQRPLDLCALEDEQYRDLIYDIVEAEGFQDLAWHEDINTHRRYLAANTVSTNPAGGIEQYKWHCTADRYQSKVPWVTLEATINLASKIEADYFLIIINESVSDDCKRKIAEINRNFRQHPRFELWDKMEIEKRIYKYPKVLRRFFPTWWSAEYEADVYLTNVHRTLRQLINRVQPIWENYADKRPFTDLIHFTAKQGRPFCDSFDLVGTLSERQRSVLRASLKVAVSLQQYLHRSLNLPANTLLIPIDWKNHPNEGILIHMQAEKILHDDAQKSLGRILTTIEQKHYKHLQEKGVIAASSSWKPWGPNRNMTCYVFSYGDEKIIDSL